MYPARELRSTCSATRCFRCYPYVPIGGEMGMNCAVMSYNGTLFVGFTGDAKAIPDLVGAGQDSLARALQSFGMRLASVFRRENGHSPKVKAAASKAAVSKVSAAHAGPPSNGRHRQARRPRTGRRFSKAVAK